MLGARHLKGVVENKTASSLFVSLGKAINGTPHLYVEDRGPVFPQKRGLVAGRAFDRKNKMPGNAVYCCVDNKSGIKPPATPYIYIYINGNIARK